MTEISRALARVFRAVARRALPARGERTVQHPVVVIEAEPTELRLRVHLGDVVVAYHEPGNYSRDTVVLPLDALDHFEGRSDEKVVLEATSPGTVRASWHEGAVPRSRDYEIKDGPKPPRSPEPPDRCAALPIHFLQALDEARSSAGKVAVRYALTRILLRGAKGEVVASDGRALLVQSGFQFPWTEDVLVPSVAIFGCRELSRAETVRVGRTATHVCIQTGPWSIYLAIDPTGHYPRIEDVIPRTNGVATTCRLDATDARVLEKALTQLPVTKDEDSPVTVDLNGKAAVRARSEQGRVTEVVLTRSPVSGPPVQLVTNVCYLQRAIQLGLTELRVGKPDAPVLARGEEKLFVWMPLSKQAAAPHNPDALHLDPAPAANGKVPSPRRQPARRGRLRQPEPVPVRVGPAMPVETKEPRRPGTGRSVWGVLQDLFTPRGWLVQRWQTKP